MKNGGCEQCCVNSYGSYACCCDPGFRLSPNLINCQGYFTLSRCSTNFTIRVIVHRFGSVPFTLNTSRRHVLRLLILLQLFYWSVDLQNIVVALLALFFSVNDRILLYLLSLIFHFITGPPNGPVLFCWLSSVVVCNAAGRRAGRPLGVWTVGAPAAGSVGGRVADTT